MSVTVNAAASDGAANALVTTGRPVGRTGRSRVVGFLVVVLGAEVGRVVGAGSLDVGSVVGGSVVLGSVTLVLGSATAPSASKPHPIGTRSAAAVIAVHRRRFRPLIRPG